MTGDHFTPSESLDSGNRTEVSPRPTEEWLIHLVDAVKDYAIFALDTEGNITTWNDGAQRLKGYSRDEIVGLHFSRFYSEEERRKNKPASSLQIARDEGRFQEEGKRLRKDGSLFWANVVITPILTPDGQLMGFSKVTRDISQRKRLEQEKDALLQAAIDRADHDPLTSLFNHSNFHHRLQVAAKKIIAQRERDAKNPPLAVESERTQSSGRRTHHATRDAFLTVAVFDMDNFKFFNDTYGHLIGDEVLCMIAGVLRSCCRAEDVVARIGGDEFAILMTGVDRDEAQSWAARLRTTVHGLSYTPPGEAAAVPLRLSVGTALYPDEASTPAMALYLADKRALHDKSVGDDLESGEAEQLRASLYNEVDGFSILDALVTAVDHKDRYTRRHSEEVMIYASRIAEALELDAAEKQSLQIAALVHDVGKIGVPNRILRRPGGLSAEEFRAMQQHVELGGLLVAAAPELAHTLDAVRHHHERWDGEGYPAGLRGEAIPRAARILAVADAYSAMTMDRPYRQGLTVDEARNRLKAGAGRQWEEACVDALLQKLEKSV